MVEQDKIDLVGAQDPGCVAGKVHLKIEAITRIKLGVVPNRDVHIRQRTRIPARLRSDQHRRDHALVIERVSQPLERSSIEQRRARFLVDDNHCS